MLVLRTGLVAFYLPLAINQFNGQDARFRLLFLGLTSSVSTSETGFPHDWQTSSSLFIFCPQFEQFIG
jgi:hypothetical protein